MRRGLAARAKTTGQPVRTRARPVVVNPLKHKKCGGTLPPGRALAYQQQPATQRPARAAAPESEQAKSGNQAESATGFYMAAIV